MTKGPEFKWRCIICGKGCDANGCNVPEPIGALYGSGGEASLYVHSRCAGDFICGLANTGYSEWQEPISALEVAKKQAEVSRILATAKAGLAALLSRKPEEEVKSRE